MKSLLSLLLIFFFHGLYAQAPQVTSTTPTGHSLSAVPANQISIDLDTALNPATVNANSVMVFGRWSGPMSGSISLENGDSRIRFVPDASFFSGEWVNVKLTSDIESAGGDNLDAGFTFGFWIRTLPGSLQQTFMEQISTE